MTFPASRDSAPAFVVPGGTAPSAPAAGHFWVSGGKLWWHNGTRPVAFLNDDGTGAAALTLGSASGAADGFRVADGATNSGTGILGHFTAASHSSMTPWQADANGVGWQVDASGALRGVGSTQSGAITLNGSSSGSCTLTVPATAGALVPGAAAECDLGSSALPIANVYLAGGSTAPGAFKLTGSATAMRTWRLQDADDVLVGRATSDTLVNKVIDTAAGNVLAVRGIPLSGVQGNSGTALFAGAVSGAGALLCTDAAGNATTANCSGATMTHSIGYAFDGGGSALTAGMTSAPVTVPFGCTISGWNVNVDQGAATVRTWKTAGGSVIPTSADSINTNGISIPAGTAVHSTALADFVSTTVSAGDIVVFYLASVSNATQVYIGLECRQ